MPDFWLDTNVFITAKNGPYGFDIAPGFWAALDQKAAQGVVGSSNVVYDELVDESDDELAQWAKERKDGGLFVPADQAVQETLREIADYVTRTYEANQARDFLKGADPWIIAHAKTYGGKVVTTEVRVPSSSRKVKIPNVCDAFDVKSIDIYQLLRDLGVSLK